VILKVRLVASRSVVSIAPFCHCSNDSTYPRRHRLTDDGGLYARAFFGLPYICFCRTMDWLP